MYIVKIKISKKKILMISNGQDYYYYYLQNKQNDKGNTFFLIQNPLFRFIYPDSRQLIITHVTLGEWQG